MNFAHQRFEDEEDLEDNGQQRGSFNIKLKKVVTEDAKVFEPKSADVALNEQRVTKTKSKRRSASRARVLRRRSEEEDDSKVGLGRWLIFMNILISFFWGLACIIDEFSYIKRHPLIFAYLILGSGMHIVSLAISFALVLVLYIPLRVCFRETAQELLGCFPIFFTLFVNCGYASLVPLGIQIMIINHHKLDYVTELFIIYQSIIASGVVIFAIYDTFSERSLLSPHLSQIEKEVYMINEVEVKPIREEIVSATSVFKGQSLSSPLGRNDSKAGNSPQIEMTKSEFVSKRPNRKDLKVTTHDHVHYSPTQFTDGTLNRQQILEMPLIGSPGLSQGMSVSLRKSGGRSSSPGKPLKLHMPPQDRDQYAS